MAYYNNTSNANFYPNSPTFDAYPFLVQTSANEEAYADANTFLGGWTGDGQPGHTVGSPTSLQAEASFGKYNCSFLNDRCLTRESPEPVPPATSHVAQTYGYGQPPFPVHYWSATGPQAQSYSGIVSRDNSFAGMVESEASTVVPTPSGGKHLFSDETLRNRVLTDREQPRSATGGTTGADHPPARFTG